MPLNSPPRPSWLDEELYPFTSRYLEISGCHVHYIDEGQGPVLLMLHGNPTWSFLYRDLVISLRSQFRCIALDYPGFGLSTAAPDYDYTPTEHARIVEQFLLTLDLYEITLLAQDWGGPIGLGVAGRHPDRFRRLVLGNTWAWPLNGDPHFERFSKFLGGPIGKFLILNFNFFVNILIPMGVRRKKLSKEMMQAYRGPFSRRAARLPTYVFPRALLHSHHYLAEVERNLRKLKDLPLLLVWGDADIAFRAQEQARFEALFPDCQTRILAGAGHYIQEDAPIEIIDALQNWEAV